MDNSIVMKMIDEAKKVAWNNKCSKYSKFTVGVTLLTKDGKMFTGCNIENHGIMSICAERVAFVKALSENNYSFACIVVVGKNISDDSFKETLPCGYCPQFMSEYCDKNFVIFTYDDATSKLNKYTLKELLPYSYDFREE